MTHKPIPHLLLLTLLLLIPVVFLWSPGTTDVQIWSNWSKNLSKYGWIEGFQRSQGDYPPLSALVLYVSGRASSFVGSRCTTSRSMARADAGALSSRAVAFLCRAPDSLVRSSSGAAV